MLCFDWLFLDMNAYFASAEQQLQPALRGKPVVVVPSMTDRTCCIAVSYEAREYGIRTGTNVGEARRRCPGLRLVEGQHENYVRIHKQIVAAVETVLPVERVCSIDEMACRISPQDRERGQAVLLAERVRRAIAEQVGPYLRCSIGLAPNRFLAKVASNMEKPNGLSLIPREELPGCLYPLALTDFPGIASNMLRRLERKGVRSTRQLCALSKRQMIEAWQSIVGEQWWYRLRGEECVEGLSRRRTVGHSHILPPKLRSDEGARGVLVRLLHKAAMRLRKLEYWTSRMVISVSYTNEWPKWKETVYLCRCQDTCSLLEAFERTWRKRPLGGRPVKTSITLLDLTPSASTTPSLFLEDRRAREASRTMDAVNERFGTNSLYFASMHETRDAVPLRISFTNIPEVGAKRVSRRRKP